MGALLGEPGGRAPLLGALKVMKGKLWGWVSLFMGAQFGNLEGAYLPGTLRYVWKGPWRCGLSLSLPLSLWELCEGNLEGELPCWGPWRICRKGSGDEHLFPYRLRLGNLEEGSSKGALREGWKGALGMGLLSLTRLLGGGLGGGAASLRTLEDMLR